MQFEQKKQSSPSEYQKGLIPTKKTLLVGYGNPDREDDGIAWHVLFEIAKRFNIPLPQGPEEGFIPQNRDFDILFDMQLMPEMVEDMLGYERICFVDAHTGAVNEEIHWENLKPVFQNSPLTHHMTPQTIVSIIEHLYHQNPETILVSIRGYQFGFKRSLSTRTEILVSQAVEKISNWICSDY